MEGLLAQGQQAAQDPRYTNEQDQGGEMASPEEQAQYEQMVQNAMKLIYTPENQPQPGILDALKAAQGKQDQGSEGQSLSPPVSALSHLAVMIVSKLDDSARESGKPLTDDVLQEGGQDVIGMLADIAQAASIHDYSPEELEGATVAAYDIYRDKAIADGRTTEDDLKQQWEGLLQADKEGRLGEYGINQSPAPQDQQQGG